MNVKIFSEQIKHKPEKNKDRYIFICDNREICEQCIVVGYYAVYLQDVAGDYFTPKTLIDKISDSLNTGTSITEYVFIPACYRKKTNDMLINRFKAMMLNYKVNGWTLFKGKEYLGKYDYQEELCRQLADYINRHEGGSAAAVNLQQFHKMSDNGQITGVYDIKVVEYILDTVPFFVIMDTPYIYEHGVYVEDGKGIRLKTIIQGLIYQQYVKVTTINNIYHLLITQQQCQRDKNDINNYPKHWINFRNGMFDVIEFKLRKHKPEYLSVNQIPHEVHKVSDITEIKNTTRRFMESAIPDMDDRIMLFQYIGYCMTVDTRFQKFLMLTGEGGTGKSQIVALFQKVVGRNNYSSISLQDLNKRFYPTQLYGKVLNACADISSEALSNTENIKKAVGEDALMYEKKGGEPDVFFSYAKLLFSANEPPLNIDEKSNAYYRRLMILEMNHVPSKEERDTELGEKLEKEMDYTIWMALLHLQQLYQDGEFKESNHSKRLVDKLYCSADSVKAYIDECVERKEGVNTERKKLYEDYLRYCKEYGRREHAPNQFYNSLERKGFKPIRTNSARLFKDITVKSEEFHREAAEAPF